MKIRHIKNVLFGLVGALVLTVGFSAFTRTIATIRFYYSVTNLGIPDLPPSMAYYTGSSAYALNDQGQVIGQLSTNTGASYPFLWKNGAIALLNFFNTKNSFAYDINNLGQVVGEMRTSNWNGIPSGPPHAVLWKNGATTDLGTLDGYTTSYGYGINETGQVVGYASSSSGSHAVLWSNSTVKDLGTLDNYVSSFATNINELGQVVGYARTSNSDPSTSITRAVLWSDGKISDLGTLDGYTSSSATDINDKGQIVGVSYTYNGVTNIGHAFLWKHGTMRDMGTLGGSESYAYGINNRGQVVGKAKTISGASHAFMWVNGKMRDLNSLIPANSGWELTEARDINSNGQIVGTGRLNNETRAFLLTPTWIIR